VLTDGGAARPSASTTGGNLPGLMSLVPTSRRPESVASLTIHRTTRKCPSGSSAWAGDMMPSRPGALADCARGRPSLREVRALSAGAVQAR